MKPFTWSWSSLELFEKNKQEWKRRYVDGIKDEPSQALIHGREVHEQMEKWMMSDSGMIKAPYAIAEPIYATSRQPGMYTHVEWKLGLTRELNPCKFFDDNVWGRCAIDVAILNGDTGVIVDWKTGKKREVPRNGQLQVCSWFAFVHKPELKKIGAFNIYLEQNKKSDTLIYCSNMDMSALLARIDKVEKFYNSFKENDDAT